MKKLLDLGTYEFVPNVLETQEFDVTETKEHLTKNSERQSLYDNDNDSEDTDINWQRNN